MAAYAATVRAPAGVIVEGGLRRARAAVRGSPALALSCRFWPATASRRAESINRANVPVLQLHGDRDSVIPFELGRELYERLTVPEAVRDDPGRRPQRHGAGGCRRVLGRDRWLRGFAEEVNSLRSAVCGPRSAVHGPRFTVYRLPLYRSFRLRDDRQLDRAVVHLSKRQPIPEGGDCARSAPHSTDSTPGRGRWQRHDAIAFPAAKRAESERAGRRDGSQWRPT